MLVTLVYSYILGFLTLLLIWLLFPQEPKIIEKITYKENNELTLANLRKIKELDEQMANIANHINHSRLSLIEKAKLIQNMAELEKQRQTLLEASIKNNGG